MIDETEIARLAAHYGEPEFRERDIEADSYLFESRSHQAASRRGEVVMVITRKPGFVLLHSKSWYDPPVLRLPTGGIDLDETGEQALMRELAEETGYKLNTATFLAFLRCHLHYLENVLTFDSLIFHLPAPAQEPVPANPNEQIHMLAWKKMRNLDQIALELRATPPPRKAWGEWRAVAHELVSEIQLTN
jgi:8-oxo-dGTP pyrophosphatase MutT (NUDIX family)